MKRPDKLGCPRCGEDVLRCYVTTSPTLRRVTDTSDSGRERLSYGMASKGPAVNRPLMSVLVALWYGPIGPAARVSVRNVESGMDAR